MKYCLDINNNIDGDCADLQNSVSNSSNNNNNNNNNSNKNVISRKVGLLSSALNSLHCFFNECDALQIAEKCGTWHTLNQDTSLVREENELLTNQLQLQKEKLQQIQVTYDERGGCGLIMLY